MKKGIKYTLLGVLAVVIIGFIVFQFYKKGIVRNAVENAITKKTDSLYYIHYDSSRIDEITGSARFFNVTLQSDSLQQQLMQSDSSAVNNIFNISVKEVAIEGLNIASFINNEKVAASSITLIQPHVSIINTGEDIEKPFDGRDSLALYEKMLGKFKSIASDNISIQDATITMYHKSSDPSVAINGINISINNFLIDSTKNYKNIAGYFVKEAKVKVHAAIIMQPATHTQISLEELDYNASTRSVTLKKFLQLNTQLQKPTYELQGVSIAGLNTDSFVLRKQLRADHLKTESGLLNFYVKKKTSTDSKAASTETIDIENNYFDEAIVDAVTINNIDVAIYDQQKPTTAPTVFKSVNFTAIDIQKVQSGSRIRNLLNTATWILYAKGIGYKTKDGLYAISIGPFVIDNQKSTISIAYCHVLPLITEAQFSARIKVQQDLFKLQVKNIRLSGVDIPAILNRNRIVADLAQLEPTLNVFNDRTVPINPASKVGKYPAQLLLKLDLPVHVKKVLISKGMIAYKEKGAQSKEKGTVFFKNVSATIQNVTNIPASIKRDTMLAIQSKAQFMGASLLTAKWAMPLNKTTGDFSIVGYTNKFNATVLNPMIEPLGMASIKKGIIHSLNFSIYGNDDEANGTSTIKYDDLSIELLKNKEGELETKVLASALANLVIKNSNPTNDVIRKGDISMKRDITKSFFNLVWKSIFSAAKRTATGKNDE